MGSQAGAWEPGNLKFVRIVHYGTYHKLLFKTSHRYEMFFAVPFDSFFEFICNRL